MSTLSEIVGLTSTLSASACVAAPFTQRDTAHRSIGTGRLRARWCGWVTAASASPCASGLERATAASLLQSRRWSGRSAVRYPGRISQKAAGVSIRYLERLFAERLDVTIHRHYVALRLAQARSLLRQSTLTVARAGARMRLSGRQPFCEGIPSKIRLAACGGSCDSTMIRMVQHGQ